MAIDKDGPSVAGDIYTKKVSVVESFAKPVPAFTLSPENGSSDTYQFNASGSYDPNGYIRYHRWDFNWNGVIDQEIYRQHNATHTYTADGYYTVTMTVEDWMDAPTVQSMSCASGAPAASAKTSIPLPL